MPKITREGLDALSDDEFILKLCQNVVHMMSGNFLPTLRDHIRKRWPPRVGGENLTQKYAARAKKCYPLLTFLLHDVLATMNRLVDLDDENIALPFLLEDYRVSAMKRWPDSPYSKFLVGSE